MTRYSAVAYTMQALVKYHGLKDWKLRLPYHDSISANTTSMMTVAEIADERRGGVFIEGKRSEAANLRLEAVVRKLDRRASVRDFRIDSRNIPSGKAKGIGYSSSAGAALTLLCQRLLAPRKKRRNDEAPEMEELSRTARLFAASAARSLVGGFSRLYAGGDDRTTYARRFADSKTMDLRMVIVPLPSPLRTEDVHRDVLSSPFFEARAKSAQKRCDEMERAILGNDLPSLGTLAEKDTLELHALTMTGAAGIVIMTEDSLRIVTKVRQLRDNGLDAYFSMQTGPSVFINTSDRDEDKVMKAVKKLGYVAYKSRVGEAAHLLPAGRQGLIAPNG